MKPKQKIYLTILGFVGICLLAGGGYGFFSLADAADDYLLTTGVITRVEHKREYRHRKIRTTSEVSVRYETTLYGDMYATLDFYVPFLMDEGDKIDVLYNPRLPRNIRLPGWESLLYALLTGIGLLMAGGSWWLMKEHPNRTEANGK